MRRRVSATRGLVRATSSVADRQKRIREAEQQLADQAISFRVETNSQTQRKLPLKMVGSKAMVAPGTRDAPKFSSKKPQELRRFLRLMEDLWQEAGIVDDDVKKMMIGKYADQESEEEWTALATYEAGHSWMEFKDELIENYPEAAAAERGTPARIKQLCSETRDIRLGDLAALYAFRRAFMAEAKKLVKPPAAMSNRELVELFLGCLSDQMASAVLQFLGNFVSLSKPKEIGKGVVPGVAEGSAGTEMVPSRALRRPEDRYDLDEVCRAAIQVSENSQGMFYLMNKPTYEPAEERGVLMFNQPVSETKGLAQKLEELEGAQALEKDRLVNVNKNIDSKFGELETMMKAILAQAQGSSNAGVDMSRAYDPNSGVILGQPGTTPKWGKPVVKNRGCFYCGGGNHFIPECDDVQEDLRKGLVKLSTDGKLRLGDGSQIPGYPSNGTIRERVMKHYAKQHSVFHFGEYETEEDLIGPSAPRFTTQYVNVVESVDKRRARLEYELDLKEKEEALELRKLKLEREEKRLEQNSKNTRNAHVLDLLDQLNDDELAAIKNAKSVFP